MKTPILMSRVSACFAFVFIFLSISGCRSTLEGLNELQEEASAVLVTYPKANRQKIHIDISHSAQSNLRNFTFLVELLERNNVEVIDPPQSDPNKSGDTPLLAALRENIGILFLDVESPTVFSEQELRGLELFVLFGGRIISNSTLGNGTSVGRRFGVSRIGQIPIDDQMYLDEGRGHLIKVEEESVKQGFIENTEVIFLFPNEISAETNKLFEHDTLAVRENREGEKPVVIKANPKLNLQNEKGYFISVGDHYFYQTQREGGTNLPVRSAYQGGLLTGANLIFLLNLMFEPEVGELQVDNEAPQVEVTLANPVLSSDNGLIQVPCSIFDIGGVSSVSYSLNGGETKVVYDPLNLRSDRVWMDKRLDGGRHLEFSEIELELGENQLRIEVLDQFGNAFTQVIDFIFDLRGTGRRIELISNLVGSTSIDPLSGMDLFGSPISYENASIYGDALSTSFWNGGSSCETSGTGNLTAFTMLASAPSGIGRVKQMDMPITSGALAGLAGLSQQSISVHFGPLVLDTIILLNGAERRDYLNISNSTFTINLAGIPIISAPMPRFNTIADHNASGNCNDDVITGNTRFIPTAALVPLSGLTPTQATIATAILADLAGTKGVRLTGTIFNRIIHGGSSDALVGSPRGTVLRLPIGVHHPDPTAANLVGSAFIEILSN